jgi:hypothetical protein
MQKFSVITKSCAMTASIGAFIGAINDLLSPMIAFSGYFLAFMAVLFFVSLLAVMMPSIAKAFSKIPVPYELKSFFSEYWAAPFLIGLVVISIAVSGCSYFTSVNSSDGGFIVKTFPEAADLQRSLGIIESNLKSIDQHSANIEKNTQEISSKADNFKREVSDDPQKELSNMGVSWSNESFSQALKRTDYRVVKLFIDAGWNIFSEDNDNGNAIATFVWLGGSDNVKLYEKIIDSLIDNGMDLNKKYYRFRGVEPTDFATTAAQACNVVALRIAKNKGANFTNAINSVTSISPPDDSPYASTCKDDIEEIKNIVGSDNIYYYDFHKRY